MNTPVKFELAKLLKEKGFDKVTNKSYRISKNPEIPLPTAPITDENTYFPNVRESYSAPTIAEVVMWLYKKHRIWIVVETALGEDIKCLFSWYCTDDEQNILCSDFDYTADGKYHHNSPTEAYEAGIEYILINIINKKYDRTTKRL